MELKPTFNVVHLAMLLLHISLILGSFSSLNNLFRNTNLSFLQIILSLKISLFYLIVLF